MLFVVLCEESKFSPSSWKLSPFHLQTTRQLSTMEKAKWVDTGRGVVLIYLLPIFLSHFSEASPITSKILFFPLLYSQMKISLPLPFYFLFKKFLLNTHSLKKFLHIFAFFLFLSPLKIIYSISSFYLVLFNFFHLNCEDLWTSKHKKWNIEEVMWFRLLFITQ